MPQVPVRAELRFGAAAAFVVAYLLRGVGRDAWRYLLASPANFAVITLLARLGTPESARWLLSKGRVEQADAAVKKVFGPQYSVADLPAEPEVKTSFIKVFQKPYLRRTIFVAMFWTAQVIPLFAGYTFAPDLLTSFGLKRDANLYGGSLMQASDAAPRAMDTDHHRHCNQSRSAAPRPAKHRSHRMQHPTLLRGLRSR
jgi:putative MFS transporter